MSFRPAVLGLVALALAGRAGSVPGQEAVTHQISFPEIQQQYVRVVSDFPVHDRHATVIMANWTPGSYVIRDHAANLDRIAARGAGGQSLRLHKIRKNAWRADVGDGLRLVVEYDVHAGSLSANTSWASPDFVLINGASVFLYTEASRELPQLVRVDVPAGLGSVFTPLPEDGIGGAWRAGDFDELVDNPVVISTGVALAFRQDGHGYRFLNVGDNSLWDDQRAVDDVRRIVGATNDLWGAVPLERDYWFFNFLVEGTGGLEHDHGTVMMSSRWQMRKREDYIKWLSLVAHEYFHAWNVRRMRPASIVEYDYESEQYSEALWLAEGVSSYYDNLLLSRARLVSPEEYFRRLAIDMHRFELTPGRKLMSLEEASRDAWIRHYRPDANSINSEVSYYTKGALVGFALDTRIRMRTGGRDSLDDVMRRMWDDWGGRAYPDRAFRDAVEAVGGAEIRSWLEPLLSTPQGPDLDQALDWYGLELNRHPEHAAAEAAGQSLTAGLGVNWDPDRDSLVVGSVIRGMAGAAAGLLPGDELIAIDAERMHRAYLEDRMQRLDPGDTVELLIARQGRIRTLELVLGEARPTKYEIRLSRGFGNREIRRMESWLGQNLEVARE